MALIRALRARHEGRLALLAAVLIFALGALTAAGCGDDDDGGGNGDGGEASNAAADCTASIGVMAPITGDAAELGEEQRNWAQFGLDRFNKENGTKLKLVEGDTQLDPGQASTVAQEFVSNDAIVAVVGPAVVRPMLHRAEARVLLREALPLAAAVAMNVVYLRLLVVLVSLLEDDVDTGLFATSFRVLELLVRLARVAASARLDDRAGAAAFARSHRGDAARLRRTHRDRRQCDHAQA